MILLQSKNIVPGVLMLLPNPGVVNLGIRSGIQGGRKQAGGKILHTYFD